MTESQDFDVMVRVDQRVVSVTWELRMRRPDLDNDPALDRGGPRSWFATGTGGVVWVEGAPDWDGDKNAARWARILEPFVRRALKP